MSDYHEMLISDDKDLQNLRDTAGLAVAESLLKGKDSTTTVSAATRTAIGIKRAILSNTIAQLTDVTTYESDRIISRLMKAGKLASMPGASFETDDTVVLA
jgi:hypothetical protein